MPAKRPDQKAANGRQKDGSDRRTEGRESDGRESEEVKVTYMIGKGG